MAAKGPLQRIRRGLSAFRTDYSKKPMGFKWRSNAVFIVATVGVGMFTDLFLYSVVVPILPFILQDRLGMPYSQVQSTTSNLLAVYAVGSVIFCPIAGVVSDKLNSRQGPFLGGLLVLMISTILLLEGTTLPVLYFARFLQGVSSAFVWTVGMALAIDTVGPENLGKAIGTLFSFASVGELFAPVAGGALYKHSGTNSVLALCLSMLVVDLGMRIFVIEKKSAEKYDLLESEDANGQSDEENSDHDGEANGTSQPSESSPLLRDSRAKDTDEDGDEDQEGTDDIDAYLIPANESRIVKAAPILYPLMHSSSIAAANLINLTQAVLLGAYDSTVPTYASELYGFDSFKAGLLFIPLSLMNLIFGPVGGWAVDRYGTKFGAVLGTITTAPVLVLLRLPKSHPFPQQAILWAALLGLMGPGISLLGSPGMVEAGAELERYYKRNPEFFGPNGPYAQLYGLMSMSYTFGLAVGPVAAGALKESIGYGNMNAILAGWCALTGIVAFIWLGGPPRYLWKKKA